jgi:hypothetical protein
MMKQAPRYALQVWEAGRPDASRLKLFYFAYGSNMCTGRLTTRVASAKPSGIAKLASHAFRFHKRSDDGSSKADAFFTGKDEDIVWGVLFELREADKPTLDRVEGLGHGYVEQLLTVERREGGQRAVFLYSAQKTHIEADLHPYSWYKRFVVEGARQHGLPPSYVAQIEALPDIQDPDRERDAKNRRIPLLTQNR